MPSGLWLYSYLALWTLLLAVSLLLVAVIRHLRELYGYWVKNDPEAGLPLGALVPALPTADVYGRPVSLGADRGKKTLLLFLSRGCKSCYRALTWIHRLRGSEDMELVLVVSAKEMETRLFLAEGRREAQFAEVLALADGGRQLTDAYKASMVPYAVLVDEGGRIKARGACSSLGEIESLLRQAEALGQQWQGDDEAADLSELPAEAEEALAEPAAA